MKRLMLAILAVSCGGELNPVGGRPAALTGDDVHPGTATDACLAQARADSQERDDSGMAALPNRRLLEIDAAACFAPGSPKAATDFRGNMNFELARLGRALESGDLNVKEYAALVRDRSRKARAAAADPAYLDEYAQGDADGDFVPDSRDACPHTKPDVPTDARGCPDKGRPEEKGGTNLNRRLRGVKVLWNPACKDLPAPTVPFPIEWGRGPQPNNQFGFNLAITQVNDGVPDCEIFYELEFRFTQGPNNVPPVHHASVAFTEKEAFSASGTRIVFGVPNPGTVSPGRAAMRFGMLKYLKTQWRVRAVNGANLQSDWSPMITQATAISGVTP